jgi:CheY-like chemotaxis protein
MTFKSSASEETWDMPTQMPRKGSRMAQPHGDLSAEKHVAGRRRSLRVLVIDNEQRTAELLTGVIRSWGHEVRWVSDGAGAWEMANAQQLDVVLLDIATPGMDGYELSQLFRRDSRLKDCLMVAMWTAQQRRSRQQKTADIDLFLAKPVDVFVLETLLLLEGERLDRLQAYKQPDQPGSTCQQLPGTRQ